MAEFTQGLKPKRNVIFFKSRGGEKARVMVRNRINIGSNPSSIPKEKMKPPQGLANP
jgi:hypothetical protein